MFGYYDGKQLEIFVGELHGTISEKPGFDNWFGWDRIFIPEWHNCVRSELSEEDYKKIYLRIKPTEAVKEFLLSI